MSELQSIAEPQEVGETTATTSSLTDSTTTTTTGFDRFTSFLKGIPGINLGFEEANECTEPTTKNNSAESREVVVLGRHFTIQDKANDYIHSLLWLSYRCGFTPIPKVVDGPQPVTFFPSLLFSKSTLNNVGNLRSLFDNENFTSDAGWGCMIRTSQNLLANALLKLKNEPDETAQLEILKLFQDNPSSAFSIHNFIRVASNSPLSVKPGQWFGPNAASYSIRQLVADYTGQASSTKVPCVYISENADLYDDEVDDLFVKEKKPLLLLFPVRLGIDQVNKYYYRSILQLLASKFSVGIAGGKPSSSFYFIGYENEQSLIYFDPHLPQVVETPLNLASYHTSNYNKLDITLLDPSMMVGVLLESMTDYKEFKQESIENKIIHFHPLVSTSQQDLTLNQSWEEVQEDDDFVNLTVPKSEEEFIVLEE
ncbi:ATG4 [Candida theae]|uniref:Cysteine protease n=1 Tax=Candida theae TaxID=1198502 RepID=A0AAD5BAE1_9ASCO|nr:ATG4 [Candida theae]KAI5948861.1 ATG4 [Candida theae]